MSAIIVCYSCDESFDVTPETKLSDPCPLCKGEVADQKGIVEIYEVEGAKTW